QPAVVAEKPKPAPEKPATASADPSADVLKAVNGWAAAWSKKDADAYLAYYARDFKTPGGEPRAEWEKARRSRITAPKSISVSVASPKVTMSGADRATVSFRQNYRSEVLKSNSRKTLVLVKAQGGWKIVEEKSG
ncbi:MAG: YybH family protein, partial [Panacagrimonas sp.]